MIEERLTDVCFDVPVLQHVVEFGGLCSLCCRNVPHQLGDGAAYLCGHFVPLYGCCLPKTRLAPKDLMSKACLHCIDYYYLSFFRC